MSLKGIYKTEVVTCKPDALITDAARLMKDRNVGNIVIVDDANGSRKPIGMITDRDIVIEAVCDQSADLKSLKVSDVMSSDLLTIAEDEWLFDAFDKMREHGVARVPVVDRQGALCGVLSASRVFKFLTNEMTEFSKLSERRRDDSMQTMMTKSASQSASAQLQ